MTRSPWLHPHRAQQGSHSYYEPVRQHAPRRYSLPSRLQPLGNSLSPSSTAVSRRAFPRSVQEQQTGLTSPTCRTPPGQKSGHPPDSSRADLLHPGSDVTLLSNDTSTAIPETRTAHRLPDPHLTHLVRLFHIAHHDGLQPTQHVVVCRHPPQGRRRRANNLHLLHSTMLESPYLQTELPSTFVAHVRSQSPCHTRPPELH
jgi:hypothetical protein